MADVTGGRPRRGGGHHRPRPDRLAAGRGERGQGLRAGVGGPVRRRQPPRGPPPRRLPRGPGPGPAGGGAAGVRRPHPAHPHAGAAAATGCSARPSTTPPGEAFDKVARFLGPRLPGRPGHRPAGRRAAIPGRSRSRGVCATTGYDFSFSGLKTSVITYVRKHPEVATADVAASFQEAVVDVLVEKTTRGRGCTSGPRSVCIGGGVAANSALRAAVVERLRRRTGCGPSSRAGPCAPTTPPWSGPPPGTASASTGRRPSTPPPTPTCGCPLRGR